MDLGMRSGTSGVSCACLANFPEDDCTIDCRDEPQKHVGEEYPDSILHALDTAITLWVLSDEQFAKDTKCDQVADEDECIHEEEEPRFEQRQHKD